MRSYSDDCNYIFNMLIEIRRNYNPVVDFFGTSMYRVTMPKCKIIDGNIVTVKHSDIEEWILKSKNKDCYSSLLKDWKIKQDNNIVSITWNNNIFKFDLNEIELISEMI